MKLKNPRHEAFAQRVAEGFSAASSYKACVSENKCSYATAETTGPALLKLSHIALRVEELRKKADDIATKRLGIRKELLLRYHLRVVETPVDEIDGGHDLCQEIARGPDGERVRMPSKTESAKAIADLCGWNAPVKSESTVNLSLQDFAEGVMAGIQHDGP